jgi:hypothetical protein
MLRSIADALFLWYQCQAKGQRVLESNNTKIPIFGWNQKTQEITAKPFVKIIHIDRNIDVFRKAVEKISVKTATATIKKKISGPLGDQKTFPRLFFLSLIYRILLPSLSFRSDLIEKQRTITMLGSRVLRQGLRAPALRAPLAKTNSFPNFVRHNSEKVKGTVVGIGTDPLQRDKETDNV